MGKTLLLGMSGYAGSGKDSVAGYLVANHDFHRIAFGDSMKQCLYALNPIVAGGPEDTVWRIKDLVDLDGWDVAKQIPEVRSLLQRFGTEAGRDILGKNVWVNAAMALVGDHERVVFSDCRFLNEANAVRDAGGLVVRIARAGVGPANSHESETGLDDYSFDRILLNDRGLPELKHLAHELVKSLLRDTADEVVEDSLGVPAYS